MRIAYIPPTNQRTAFAMALESWQLANASLFQMFIESEITLLNRDRNAMFRDLPGYKILDNGVYESNVATDIHSLMSKAGIISADEIILPDVMGSCDGTLAATNDALRHGAELLDGYALCEGEGKLPRFMFVPQGQSTSEWFTCLERGVAAYSQFLYALPSRHQAYRAGPVQLTIGLAKHHDMTLPVGHYRRILHSYFEHGPSLDYPLHLLGWPDRTPLADVINDYRWVRSMDTARPFVRALYRHAQGSIHALSYLEDQFPRPDDYFNLRFDNQQWECIRQNVGAMERAL